LLCGGTARATPRTPNTGIPDDESEELEMAVVVFWMDYFEKEIQGEAGAD